MATIKHKAKASAETVMTTEMNALASGSLAITSSAISNDAAGELDLYADFRLYLATQGTARSAGANVTVWILPEVDGTYPYGSAALEPQAELIVGSFSFDAAVTARYAVLRDVPLSPSDFHLVVQNNTGQALGATGNTIVIERHSIESA